MSKTKLIAVLSSSSVQKSAKPDRLSDSKVVRVNYMDTNPISQALLAFCNDFALYFDEGYAYVLSYCEDGRSICFDNTVFSFRGSTVIQGRIYEAHSGNADFRSISTKDVGVIRYVDPLIRNITRRNYLINEFLKSYGVSVSPLTNLSDLPMNAGLNLGFDNGIFSGFPTRRNNGTRYWPGQSPFFELSLNNGVVECSSLPGNGYENNRPSIFLVVKQSQDLYLIKNLSDRQISVEVTNVVYETGEFGSESFMLDVGCSKQYTIGSIGSNFDSNEVFALPIFIGSADSFTGYTDVVSFLEGNPVHL